VRAEAWSQSVGDMLLEQGDITMNVMDQLDALWVPSSNANPELAQVR
jgi:hypothetical protein